MPGEAILESTCSIFRQRDAGSRVTERVRPSRSDHRFQSSQMTALFCARRLTARQAFVPAYRTRIVGFAGYFDRACVQTSVFEFQHLDCGCGCCLQLSAVATCASRTLSKRRATCLLRSAYGERFSNHLRRNFASRHGDILRVSTALRLRDNFSTQDQMFKGCAARAAV